MHKLSLAAFAALAAALPAQSPLTTLYAYDNYNSVGGTVFFDLNPSVPLSIFQIDLNCSPLSTVTASGTLTVFTAPSTYVGNELNSSAWTQVSTGSFTINAPNSASPCTLNTPFALPSGPVGIMLQATNFSFAYTNGTGTNQNYSTVEMSLTAGASANVPFTAPFTPRVFNGAIYYASGSNVASFQRYGTGCYNRSRSYYENFVNTAAFDLGSATASNSYQHIFTGNGYLVLPPGNNWHTPTGTNLGLSDDSEITQALPFTFPYPGGSTTQLIICSNGFISPAASNGSTYIPDVNAWLTGNPRYCLFWHDLNPSAGGQVIFDSDPVNGVVYVTWSAVPTYGGGGSNTFQAAFYSTGFVEFRYQSMSGQATTSGNVLVGWSPGGGARDPGSRDISATVPFQTDPADTVPLDLTASARPVLGNTINLVTSQIPAGSPAGALIFSFTRHNPGLSLASIGMPGCLQYVGLDVTSVFLVAGTSVNSPLAIPSNPIHAGSHVYCQSATFTSGFNALGVIASNGLELKLDVQ